MIFETLTFVPRTAKDEHGTQFAFQIQQLAMECWLDTYLASPALHILQRLVGRPFILSHQIRRYQSNTSALAPEGMNQDTQPLLETFINKSHDFIQNLTRGVQNYLTVVVAPREREILNAKRFELIHDLARRAIHDSRNLVRTHKLEVLRGRGVAKKQTVLDLYRPNFGHLYNEGVFKRKKKWG